MSVTVVYDKYSVLCEYYGYGKELLNLPDDVIEKLDNHFDGMEFKKFDVNNPDDLAINSFVEIGTKEVLVDYAELVSCEEYERLLNEEHLLAYIDEHEEEIIASLTELHVYLGHEGDSWFLLQ